MMRQSRPANLLPKREEERLVEASRRVLLDGGYPNPERVGCPGSDALRALAAKRVDLKDAQGWILHVGTCSPCFIDYEAFRKQAERRKTLFLTLAAAAVFILAIAGIWLWKTKPFRQTAGQPQLATVLPYEKMTLDLRHWVVFRNGQAPSGSGGPIQFPRRKLQLTILLPAQSKAGNYKIQVSSVLEKPLVNAIGTAGIANGMTVLTAQLDVSRVNPGTYLLIIAKPGKQGRSYPLVVK